MLPQFLKDLEALYKTYYPIEIDPKLTYDEKVPHMKTWWTKLHQVFINENISKQSKVAIFVYANKRLNLLSCRIGRDD